MIGTDTVRTLAGLRQIWFSPADIPAEGHYWPLPYTSFWLEHKPWGDRVGLPHRQRAVASGQYAAVVASVAQAHGTWGLGIRGPSRTRRVGRVDHRAQGRALGHVLPARRLGMGPLGGAAAPSLALVGAGGLRRFIPPEGPRRPAQPRQRAAEPEPARRGARRLSHRRATAPDDCKPPYGSGLALHHLGRLDEAAAACRISGSSVLSVTCWSAYPAPMHRCSTAQPHGRFL